MRPFLEVAASILLTSAFVIVLAWLYATAAGI